MFAPPVAAASSDIHPPMEKALASESTMSQLCFPNEFPYEFASSAFTSPEAEDETNDDEDDFLAGLTRRLALFTQRLPSPPPPVAEAKVNSTESTRSELGNCTTSGKRSPNGPFSQTSSPPETPCRKDDSVKVVSAAAGEVAKIKDSKPSSRPNPKPKPFTPFPQNAAFYNYYNYYYYWLRQSQAALVTYHYPVGGVFASSTAVKQPSTGPTAVKQPSVGTGVFFPLNGANPSRSRKKEGKCVKFPTKVVQTQSPKTEKLSGRIQSRSQGCVSTGRSKLDRGTESAIIGGCLKEEGQLPQEWMY